DAVVGHPALREVVGADALRAVAGAHLALAGVRTGGVEGLALLVVELDLQRLHGPRPVLVLRLLRTGDYDAGGQVGDAHGAVGLVHVLAAGAGGAVGVDPDVGVLDVDLHVLGLGQDGDGGGGGMDAALR